MDKHARYREVHRKEVNARRRAWYAEHKDEVNNDTKREYCRQYRAANREKIKQAKLEKRRICLLAYGGKCVCCGEDRFEFLSFDHVNGGGNEHRRQVHGGSGFVDWIYRNGFPSTLQVLCHNCNMAKGFYGYCPHQKGN